MSESGLDENTVVITTAPGFLHSLCSQVKTFCIDLNTRDSRELNSILDNPYLDSLMETYDSLSPERFELLDMSREMSGSESTGEEFEGQSNEGHLLGSQPHTIKVVGILKHGDEPLGITVRIEDDHIIIARIIAGGLVDRQGLLHVGDTILEVNGTEVHSHKDLQEELKRSSKGSITFKVVPSFQEPPVVTPSYMRAMYTYDPAEDSLIPCKELGLAFNQGDILEILNQEDPNWWQARRVDPDTSQVGLIPSAELEERRRAFVRPEFDYATTTSICGTRITKKKKKEMYHFHSNTEFDKAELTLYEEVCRMPPFERQTLVLVGAQGVGRRTLKQRMISYDPERFATPLPHTSRPIREGEEDGKVYHFVKREIMEQDILDNKYLEFGEHQGHLYGTKLDSIRAIIRTGKMCIVDCNPQCLKLLKTPEFKPYVVFIAAPNIEQLRFMHEWGKHHGLNSRTSTFDRSVARSSRRARTMQSLVSFYEDEDLQAIVDESAKLHRAYEKYFDLVIVNSGFEKAFEQLRESVDCLSVEPQWVPVQWVYSE